MKTIVRDPLPDCDLCGREDLKDVWDRPCRGSSWAFCCVQCHTQLPKTTIGTHLTNREPWEKKYPKYARLMSEIISVYSDKDVIDRAYALYDDEGLLGQIPYVNYPELTRMKALE